MKNSTINDSLLSVIIVLCLKNVGGKCVSEQNLFVFRYLKENVLCIYYNILILNVKVYTHERDFEFLNFNFLYVFIKIM